MSDIQVLPGIIGQNTQLFSLAKKINKISHSDRSIFFRGATGSGKELFAHAVHVSSGRSGRFIAVNCGAIPESLFESLLFGHERGAFTGAHKKQEGYLSQACGGTLFLDEIAELPLLQQTKLLRVLETGSYSRIGSQEEECFTGRTVTATHADIRMMIKNGLFREDLLYRINTFELEIPTLEERRDDIPLLAKYFSQKIGDIQFSDCALSYLQCASWPGNIRQLKNSIDRICILSDDKYVTASCIEKMQECTFEDQPLAKLARSALSLAKGDKIKEMVEAMVSEALTVTDGNKTKAAEILGVHRKVVERRCHKKLCVNQPLSINVAEGVLEEAV